MDYNPPHQSLRSGRPPAHLGRHVVDINGRHAGTLLEISGSRGEVVHNKQGLLLARKKEEAHGEGVRNVRTGLHGRNKA